MSKFKISIWVILLFLVFSPQSSILAEDEVPQYPVYVVQAGDNLGQIALRFGVSVTELMEINGISDPNNINIGSELKIPGLTGIEGKLITKAISLGDNLQSLSLRYQFPIATLIKLNHITSPDELYAGASLILLEDPEQTQLIPQAVLDENQSLLELALIQQTNPWEMILRNSKSSAWVMIPGTVLYGQPESTNPIDSQAITPNLTSISISPEILFQGTTAVIHAQVKDSTNLTGSLGGYPLHFYQEVDGIFVAYQGIHAKQPPGLMEFTLYYESVDFPAYRLEQLVMVKPGGYSSETLIVDPVTIEPEVNEQENNLIMELVNSPTPGKKWTTPLTCPLDPPICIKSWFGTRRTYNDGAYSSFHSGLDLGVCSNLNVYATAPGKVIFADILTVRGNAVYIDHGWGIITGYFHLDSINTSVGEEVEAGQLIGIMGATGRVTGTHLHYEIMVNGVHVNPQEWLDPSCQ